MTSNAPWHELLASPGTDRHIAQTYQEERFLMEAVGIYASAGLSHEQGVLLIATQAHLQAFDNYFVRAGIDVDAAKQSGRLLEITAETLLPEIMVNGLPDPETFKRCVESALAKAEAASGAKGLRIYGELVNVLWLAGNFAGAMALEELWNRLQKTRPFTLFCAYKMDSLETGCAGSFQSLCQSHTHLIPAEHYNHLNAAVETAAEGILGSVVAKEMQELSKEKEDSLAEMPAGQKMLLWLRKNIPVSADAIADRSRERYQELT